jgi:molybdate transport system permease protein
MAIDWFPLWLSLRVASLSTLIALLAALWVAWLLSRKPFGGRQLVEAVLDLPLVLPPTVVGYYLLILLGRSTALGRLYESVFGQPLVFTWQAAVVAAWFHSAPLLIRSTRAALEGVPPHYAKLARSLGAGEWKVFWQVTLPLAWGPVLAATTLAFARSLGDFGITIMLAGRIPGRTQTLSVAIYDAVEAGQGDVARSLVLAISVIVVGLLYLARRFERPGAGQAG